MNVITQVSINRIMYSVTSFSLLFAVFLLSTSACRQPVPDQQLNSKDIHFLERPQQIEDLFQYPALKGKLLYVDVWGTRCGPCFKQFEFKDQIRTALSDYPQVVFLYLATTYTTDTVGSIYAQDRSRWKEFVMKYELKGYHLYLDHPLFEATWNFLEGPSAAGRSGWKYSIPRYFIIDPSGHLIVEQAYRPSQTDSLVAQIKQFL